MAQTESLVVSISEKGALVVKRNVEGIGKGARKAEGSVKLLNRALGGFAALGIAAGFATSIKMMASFSQEMSTVSAITNATTAQFEAMREVAKDLGTNTRFSATQAAEGMTFLARAGFSANQVVEAIGPTLQLAQAGALDLGRAADIASNILTGFRINVDEAGRVMDVLALAANSANTDVSQLGEAMKFIAPISAGLGVSLEETTAAVQALSDAGIQASMAGTGLRMIMRLLEAPTSKQIKIFDELGVKAEEVRVSQVGLTGALQRLSEAGIKTGQSLDAFGRAGTAFDVLVNAVPKVERFTAANEAAEGTAARIAKTMDDNLNGALLAVKSAWEGLVLAFGDLGSESALTQFFQNLATVLRTLAANLDLAVKLFGALGIAIAAIKWAPFLAALSAGNVGIMSMTAAVTKLKLALTALSLNPLTVGFVALGAAISATLVYFDKLNKMQDEIEAVEERIYRYQLKRLQAQVAEIKQRKANTANLQNYIAQLERENQLLGMTQEAREEEINISRALEIAKRPLTDLERERVVQLLEERRAIEAANQVREQENQLLEEILKPQQEYAHQKQLLDGLLARNAVSQEQYNAELARMKELYDQVGTGGGFDEHLANLQRENQLLAMNNEEREVARALDAAQATLPEGQTLTTGQSQQIEDAVRLRQETRALGEEEARRQALLQEIVGPQTAYNTAVADLNVLLAEGTINQEQFDTKLTQLKENMMGVEEVSTVVKDSLGTIWMNGANAIDEFVDSGTLKFKDFAMSVVKDITKIAAKLAILQAVKGAFGLAGLPAFATGGSFTVGGSGGTDSQPVAFMATPGERVDVLTPAQQAAQQQGQQAVAAPASITIVNVVDPDQIPSIMASAQGQQAVLNTIQLNSTAVRQAIA